MEITSKGLQSEFIFHEFGGVITDHGDCISVRTPSNPDFYFGNFLLFPAPPTDGDFGPWMARFEEIFAQYPQVRHHTFQWLPADDANSGELAEFKEAGFTLDETSVLATQSVHTDKPAPIDVDFRKISTDAEWLAVIDAQVRYGNPTIPSDEYRKFKEESFASYRAMSDKGLGNWWGAFKGDELVADLGLFFANGVGRFQSVQTATEHRRQGICRAMVDHVSNYGLTAHPDITLVLWADAHDVARDIYCSIGFNEIETLNAAFRPPIKP
jgi:hypothetical protein